MKSLYFAFLVFLSSINLVESQTLNAYFSELNYRNIGPFRGGRANAGTGVEGEPLHYYMGTTGGGVWKTTDGGQHWQNISDGFFNTSSVGAIAVSKSDTNVVYVGMGEHAPRGVMTSHGDGVYKSEDAGQTWTHMGLEKTQHISRIIIHPTHPDTLWVAAQGALHGPSSERGVYKSTDGGKTWIKTLFVNDLTGASEISMDLNNPNVLYAAMWEHLRKPWKVISGGSGSGLYKSRDGGLTWETIHDGLPEEKGKMAIAVSQVNSELVYALIESDSNLEKGGLFVSDNAGSSWTRVSDDHRLIQRAWYYIELALDPNDENTLYILSASTYKSIDGGKTWEEVDSAHGDYHDLWINPDDSKNMILTSDGGCEITFDSGDQWSRIDHLPTAQFYRVTTDNLFPYNVYGGQQDNTSVKIASIGIGSSTIGKRHWSPSAGGESAFLAFNPDKPDKVMGGSYLGTIEILDVKSQTSNNIMIEPNLYLGLAARDMKYLYNWNAPIIKSKHETNTYYHGAQYVLRSRDEGVSWEVISPDLTRNDDSKQGKGGGPLTNEAVGAENYGTLSYIVESPHESGVMYTGSDDGMVYITKNNGASWENITPKKLDETLINSIEVSPTNPGTVYIATTRYKMNDFTPGLFKSTNYGKTWKVINNGIPDGVYTRVVREDSSNPKLLFAGTFSGVYCSWDGGSQWQSLQLNLPITPITDLAVSHNDLVVATQGRSFWILDDIELLRQYKNLKGTSKLYEPTPVMWANWGSALDANSPDLEAHFEGDNPASGMVIYYELPRLPESSEITLSITDASGALVNAFSSKVDSTLTSYEGGPSKPKVLNKKEGLNRFVWNLRHEDLPGIPEVYIEGSYKGHKAIPGDYTITISSDDMILETTGTVVSHPMSELKKDDYIKYQNFMTKAEVNYKLMTQKTNALKQQLDKIEGLMPVLKEKNLDLILEHAKTIFHELKAWDSKMAQRLSKAYDDVENYENGFTAHYLTVINQVDVSNPIVTQGARSRIKELNKLWEVLKLESEAIEKRISAFNILCFEAGIGVIY